MTLANHSRARDDRSPAHPVSGVSVSRSNLIMNTAVSVASLASATAVVEPIAARAADAIKAATADPIFAAIKEHRRLHARWRDALHECEELERRLPEEIMAGPRVALFPKLDYTSTIEKVADRIVLHHLKAGTPTGEMYTAGWHADITRNATAIPKEHRAAWLADRHAALSAANRSYRAARKGADAWSFGFLDSSRLCQPDCHRTPRYRRVSAGTVAQSIPRKSNEIGRSGITAHWPIWPEENYKTAALPLS
jgi:hypothetical protein